MLNRIIPIMTSAQENAKRQKNLTEYIRRLEQRYSETERRGAVALLRERLAARIKEAKRNGFQA